MSNIRHLRKKVMTLGATATLLLSGLLPAFLGTAHAAGVLSSRKLEVSSALPSATGVWHEFTFNVEQGTAIGSMEFQYCTTPLGTCTGPTGLDFTSAAPSLGTTSTDQTINGLVPSNTFAIGTGGNAPTANDIKIDAASTNSISATQTVKIRFTGITNPSTTSPTSNTFFVRVTTYGTTGYGSAIDSGNVASAITNGISVAAKVQEVLHFCVDNATTVGGMLSGTSLGTDCSNFVNSYAVSGTTVDLGVIDSTTAGQSPVAAASGGNAADGVMMVRSNGLNGVTVGYRAVQQSGTNHAGSLRVVGQACNAGTVATDRCFNSQSSKTALVASTEQFGMTGRSINRTSSTVPTSNLALDTDFDSTSTTGYAWDETGAFDRVAYATDVVDDEAVVLGFGAVAALTTPPGQYTAQADFIAVPTY